MTWSAARKISGEADADEGTAGWAFHELQGCAKDDGTGAFAADEGTGHVEVVFGEQFVEIKAGDAAGDTWESRTDLFGVWCRGCA